MKLSSSASFDLGSNEAAAGCVAGILHRFLCGSLRCRASRDGDEGNGIGGDDTTTEERKAEQRKPQRPGIVARLMGLDSMPVFPYAPPDSIRRSRSTNSAESWHGVLPDERSSHGLQMRTSRSFREVPTYLRQENEDFLLLSFTPNDTEEASASEGVIPMARFGEMREGKKESRTERRGEKKRRRKRNGRQDCPKGNTAERKHGSVEVAEAPSLEKNVHCRMCGGIKTEDSVKPRKHRESPASMLLESSGIARMKQAYAQKKVESECSPQNSSPVSVLDHPCTDEGCATDPNSPTSEGWKPKELNSRRKLSSAPNYLISEEKPKQQSSRRKLSSEFQKPNCMPPCIPFVTAPGNRISNRSKIPEQACSQFLDTWGKICGLAEKDVKNSTCFLRGMMRRSLDIEEIAIELGMEMLDLLLCEAVCEISSYTATS